MTEAAPASWTTHHNASKPPNTASLRLQSSPDWPERPDLRGQQQRSLEVSQHQREHHDMRCEVKKVPPEHVSASHWWPWTYNTSELAITTIILDAM